ncbi:MAG TPA: PilW family protein [Kofleriaceae bacterium]|nr:PilW family protein [Kofleriaceae bacterium]
MTRQRGTGEAGMTLIELMIAMVILGIVVAAAMNVAYTIMNGYRDHRKAMAVERSARGAMTVLADAIRNASPGVENAQITDLVGCSTLTGIDVTNRTDGPDSLQIVYASGAFITSIRQVFDQDSTEVVVLDGSGLKAGDQILITDFDDRGHLMAITDVTDNGGDYTLALASAPTSMCSPSPPAFSYPVLSTVIKAQVAEFTVDDTGDIPVLMMDRDGAGAGEPEPVAEGIEDLQIAIGVDENGDSEVSADAPDGVDEWFYNHVDDVDPALAITARPYRALRVTVVARSIDETTARPTSIRPAAEDHAATTQPDVFRRRSLSTRVEIRNLQGSPL